MEIRDHLTCLLRNLYAGQEATVRTGHDRNQTKVSCIAAGFLLPKSLILTTYQCHTEDPYSLQPDTLPLRVNEYQPQNITNASEYNPPFYFSHIQDFMKILGASHYVRSRQHCGLTNYRKYFLLYEIQLLRSPNLRLSDCEFQLLISSSRRQSVDLLIFDLSFSFHDCVSFHGKRKCVCSYVY